LGHIPFGFDHAHHKVLLNDGAEDDTKDDGCYRKAIGLEKVSNYTHDQHRSYIEYAVINGKGTNDAEHENTRHENISWDLEHLGTAFNGQIAKGNHEKIGHNEGKVVRIAPAKMIFKSCMLLILCSPSFF